MTESRLARVLLRFASGGVLAFLYLPLIVIVLYAFNPSRIQAWPPQGFTLHWFQEALDNRNVMRAVINSLLAGTFATITALVLGTLTAIAVHRYSFFGRQTISFLFVLPIALPGVVTGIALQRSFITFEIDFGLLTIVIGHATFCVVIVFNNVIARLRRLPTSPEEASADLGGDVFTTFRRITAPRLGTALLSAALLSFALSFDEIIVTLFTAGPGTQTIPMFIFSSIQRPNELPVVNVVAFVLILASIVPVWLAQRISGAETAGARL
ncbi:MAG TPA: ABC transporter permease [Candidatus Limnocylindrales bacterium]|nr:ABC transporter permease [Candidatus Limnocylindrales bacterium]